MDINILSLTLIITSVAVIFIIDRVYRKQEKEIVFHRRFTELRNDLHNGYCLEDEFFKDIAELYTLFSYSYKGEDRKDPQDNLSILLAEGKAILN